MPQLSVRLAELSDEHRDVVAHWLGFWRRHSTLLLHSQLQVAGVDRDYAVVSAAAADVAVTARYGDGPVSHPGDGCREWHVVNGGEAGVVVAGLDAWAPFATRSATVAAASPTKAAARSAASSGSTCPRVAGSPRAR